MNYGPAPMAGVLGSTMTLSGFAGSASQIPKHLENSCSIFSDATLTTWTMRNGSSLFAKGG